MNSLKTISTLAFTEFNLKSECISFIHGRRNSAILSKMLFNLKKDIPNLSNHEAIEVLLDHNERIEMQEELNKGFFSELKRIFFAK